MALAGCVVGQVKTDWGGSLDLDFDVDLPLICDSSSNLQVSVLRKENSSTLKVIVIVVEDGRCCRRKG